MDEKKRGQGDSVKKGRDKHIDYSKIYEKELSDYMKEHAAIKTQDGSNSINHTNLSEDEKLALKKAKEEADDRYLANYQRNFRRRSKHRKVSTPTKALINIYAFSSILFIATVGAMNVLPIIWMTALFLALLSISALILSILYRKRISKWTRHLAAFMAALLIFFYGIGTVYSFSTMSFLNATTVDNEKHVRSITKDPFHVVVTGIDAEGDIDEPGRSDVNMVLTINPETHQMLMTSIPRDYQIYMPEKNKAVDKLTHTGNYGVDCTMAAEGDLLGIEPNYYVKVNFTTVKEFIDAIGGVDVYSEYEFSPMNGWTVRQGLNYMNGEQALAFSRTRYAFEEGDRQRIKNQQAVFEAMFRKATSSPSMVLNYNTILSELKDYFRMSFSSKEIRSLVKLQLSSNAEWKIYKNTLTGGDAMMPTYSGGNQNLYVMTRDEQSIANARFLISAVTRGNEIAVDENGMADTTESSDD